jgi:hypothetical protein
MAVPQTEAGLIAFMEKWLTDLIGPLSAEGTDRPDRRRYWAKVLSNQKKEWRKRVRTMMEQPVVGLTCSNSQLYVHCV